MPWLEEKEYVKLRNQIKKLDEDLTKWKRYWNEEATKIEKAQTILNTPLDDGDYLKRFQELRETLSPKERVSNGQKPT